MNRGILIADLCGMIDQLNLIQAQAVKLAQYETFHYTEEIAAVRADYAKAVGGEMTAE